MSITREQAIAEFNRLESEFHGTRLTRDYFRQHSQIPGSFIEKEFGGFSALRQAANPEGVLTNTSTLYKVEGEDKSTVLVWEKRRHDFDEMRDQVREAVEVFLEDAPKLHVPDAPFIVDNDIIPWIQIGDAHLGMLAHAWETGENFNLQIAEQELMTAVSMLVDMAPDCERCVINDLGDFTDYENFSATTEASGNPMDYDGRFPKMIDVYARLMRAIMDKALSKFKYVDVIINQGNHSRTNDIWMRVLLEAVYGPTGRVNVLNNDSVFIGYRMGNTFVMTHHSDKAKPKDLINVMTTDFARDWGETTFRYIDIGHIHHGMAYKDNPGVVVESWNILAPNNKWAHEHGYRSRRSISLVLRSKTYGEEGRYLLPVEKIKARLGKMIEPRRAFAV